MESFLNNIALTFFYIIGAILLFLIPVWASKLFLLDRKIRSRRKDLDVLESKARELEEHE